MRLPISVSGRVLVTRIASSASRCERLESGLDTMICRLTYAYFRLKLANTGISNDEATLLIAATRNGPTRFENWIPH